MIFSENRCALFRIMHWAVFADICHEGGRVGLTPDLGYIALCRRHRANSGRQSGRERRD
jgi:hypothetical protein